MASSDTQIVNLAISHLGIGKEISNLATDKSAEGLAARRFFDIARRKAFREFEVPFATKFATLGLVSEQPTDEWGYSYRYPSDCLFMRRILSGRRQDTRQSRVPYIIIGDSAGRLIYTDFENATAEYSIDVTDYNLWPDDYVLGFSYFLAMMLVPRLTSGDPFKIRDSLKPLMDEAMGQAIDTGLNEQQDEEHPRSEFERVRGGESSERSNIDRSV